MLTRMARLLTRMARMARMLTRMTRWLAYCTYSTNNQETLFHSTLFGWVETAKLALSKYFCCEELQTLYA